MGSKINNQFEILTEFLVHPTSQALLTKDCPQRKILKLTTCLRLGKVQVT